MVRGLHCRQAVTGEGATGLALFLSRRRALLAVCVFILLHVYQVGANQSAWLSIWVSASALASTCRHHGTATAYSSQRVYQSIDGCIHASEKEREGRQHARTA